MNHFLTATLAALAIAIAPCASLAQHQHDHKHAEGHEGHNHAAPHGGSLAAIGDGVGNLEMVHDAKEGRLTAYVLDGCAENPVRLKTPALEIMVNAVDKKSTGPLLLTLQPVASPLTGETAGDTSEFTTTDPGLKGRKKLQGQVRALDFQGKQYKDIKFVIGK